MPATVTRMNRKTIRTTIRRRSRHRMIMKAMIMVTATIIIALMAIDMTSIATMSITTAIPMLMTANKTPTTPRRRGPAVATKQSGDRVKTSIGEHMAQPAGYRSAMKEIEPAALYRLMTWLSPSFPIGAFSYSSGIEWAVEAGDIVDAASLRDWLGAMLAVRPRSLT